uniref:Microfibril-associated glycoprotein 4 n=1 Tax=Sphaerodactylus townsendi TaxID=933632 RepID=A0ACB8EUW4_9SAUR
MGLTEITVQEFKTKKSTGAFGQLNWSCEVEISISSAHCTRTGYQCSRFSDGWRLPHLPRGTQRACARVLRYDHRRWKMIIFQKRFNGTTSFFRGWNDYKFGFGRADSEYWLGLQNIHHLTLKNKYELRVELEDFENNTSFAKYADFPHSSMLSVREEDGYTLHVSGFTDGEQVTLRLSYHHQGCEVLITLTAYHDLYCRTVQHFPLGAEEFKSCHFSNLNGFYLWWGLTLLCQWSFNWAAWKGFYYSLKKSEMKIRRV